ncbi:hypothetical protein ABQG64_01145, partial [Escherichia coli]
KFRCVPHLTGRRFEHGVTDCYTLLRDAYHLAGIEMPDFQAQQASTIRIKAMGFLSGKRILVTGVASKLSIVDFHREDDWWRNGQNLYLDNLEATGLYQVPLSAAQPGDVL